MLSILGLCNKSICYQSTQKLRDLEEGSSGQVEELQAQLKSTEESLKTELQEKEQVGFAVQLQSKTRRELDRGYGVTLKDLADCMIWYCLD